MTTTNDELAGRLVRCRCVLLAPGGRAVLEGRCRAMVPADVPFCPDCEDRHPGAPNGVGAVPVGQP